MNTLTIEKKLLDDWKWWQGVANHTVEHATMDSQSNYTFRKAQDKLASIERALKRVKAGTFERCDDCGARIELERLEMLIDSDCHVCARCAALSKTRESYQPLRRNQRSEYHRGMPAMEWA